MEGQINLGSPLGDLIFKLAGRKDVKTIVEIGTWNGLGGTRCVLEAIKGQGKDFTSIELYPEVYAQAVLNLKSYGNQVKLVKGSIVSTGDLAWIDFAAIRQAINTGQGPEEIHIEHARQWFNQDMELIRKATNVIGMLPKSIDLLILDGGEYTTYSEWVKLKDRTRIFVLDDTKLFKCKRIREEMLSNGKYEVLVDEQNYRNGYTVFEVRNNVQDTERNPEG